MNYALLLLKQKGKAEMGNEDKELAVETFETTGEAPDLVAGLTAFEEAWPGNALEAEVAEKIMGWHRWFFPAEPDHVYLYEPEAAPWLSRFNVERTSAPYTKADTSMHRFSSNMDAAMRVVEKMGATGWQFAAVNARKIGFPASDNVRWWWVEFSNLDCEEFAEESDSLPAAICRAALAAVTAEGK